MEDMCETDREDVWLLEWTVMREEKKRCVHLLQNKVTQSSFIKDQRLD